MIWFARFAPVLGLNNFPARMATPSGGGGCMVRRAASNGGASGRDCANAATTFPASHRIATYTKTILRADFQHMAISSRMFAFIKRRSGKRYYYTLTRKFQTENVARNTAFFRSAPSVPRSEERRVGKE